MKTIKVILIFFLLLTVCSCSKNDDDNSCSSDFLECYGGTKWTYENNQNIIYRFSNNLNSPIEKWDSCLPTFEGYFYFDATNFELIENTKEKLTVLDIFTGNTQTFETDGNQLITRLIPAVYPGVPGHLIETSIDVYNLQLCN